MAGEDGEFGNDQGCLAAAGTRLDVEGIQRPDDAQPGIIAALSRERRMRKFEDAAGPGDIFSAYFGQMQRIAAHAGAVASVESPSVCLIRWRKGNVLDGVDDVARQHGAQAFRRHPSAPVAGLQDASKILCRCRL